MEGVYIGFTDVARKAAGLRPSPRSAQRARPRRLALGAQLGGFLGRHVADIGCNARNAMLCIADDNGVSPIGPPGALGVLRVLHPAAAANCPARVMSLPVVSRFAFFAFFAFSFGLGVRYSRMRQRRSAIRRRRDTFGETYEKYIGAITTVRLRLATIRNLLICHGTNLKFAFKSTPRIFVRKLLQIQPFLEHASPSTGQQCGAIIF
jgi:hypothetical protein